jgi:hypothetical protein
VDEGRERLRQLSARLVALHAALLGCERRVYEAMYGPTEASELLRQVIHHDQFAWLRSLSGMIVRIDEALDADGSAAEVDVESFFGEADRLLRSGGSGAFETKYRDALQGSPEAVMAHAEVVKVLRASRPPAPPSQ